MPSIRALTNEAQAVLAHARQDYEAALRHLHLARQLWSSIDGRVQTMRLRLRIAKLQVEHDDVRGAEAEVHAAQLIANELGSHKLRADCATLQGDIDARKVGHALAGARR